MVSQQHNTESSTTRDKATISATTTTQYTSITAATNNDAPEPTTTNSNNNNPIVTKAVRRSKKTSNKLRQCKVLYLNIRGFKSKMASLKEILIDEQPEIVGLTETMLDAADVVEREGYSVYRSDRDREGGGILVAVKKVLKGLIVEESVEKNEGESMWVSLGSPKINLRIGLVYNPQESKTKKDKLKEVYQRIEEEIKLAKQKNQRTLLMGDFNCKVGKAVSGNKEEVTVGGKMLLQMLKRNCMSIANNGTRRCDGLWTRQSGMERSVIDYIVIDESQIQHIQRLIVDEGKNVAPFRRKIEDGVPRMVYSDHNTILLTIDLLKEDATTKRAQQVSNKVMNSTAYIRFRELLAKEKVSKIWERGLDFQEAYDKWSSMVAGIRKRCEVKKKKVREGMKLTNLRRTKRGIRKQMKEMSGNSSEQGMYEARLRLMTNYIDKEKVEQERRRVRKTEEELTKDNRSGVNQNAFWKFKRKTENKKSNKRLL